MRRVESSVNPPPPPPKKVKKKINREPNQKIQSRHNVGIIKYGGIWFYYSSLTEKFRKLFAQPLVRDVPSGPSLAQH